MGRPRTDPALLARAVAEVRAGRPALEVAAELGIGKSTLYAALRPEAGVGARKPAAPNGNQADDEDLPDDDDGGGIAGDLRILSREIEGTRKQLVAMRRAAGEGARTHGLAALGAHLARLLRDRAAIRPPPPVDPAEQERIWRADADAVIAAIESKVKAAEAKRDETEPKGDPST